MIDWFTVAAQIVNFLILVALLKYFLYGRIVDAMDRREQSIAQRWNLAEQREAELQQELAYVVSGERDASLRRTRYFQDLDLYLRFERVFHGPKPLLAVFYLLSDVLGRFFQLLFVFGLALIIENVHGVGLVFFLVLIGSVGVKAEKRRDEGKRK